MSAVETLTVSAVPTASTLLPFSKTQTASGGRILIQNNNASPTQEKVTFDPKKHLAHSPPPRVYTMPELGYSDRHGVSPVGVSEPFPLFSPEAVQQMRSEALNDEVWDKYQFSSNLAQCQLRGYAPECAPFIYDVWKHPETLAAISKIAGVDLVPAMDFEIGHINISVHSEEEKAQALEAAEADKDQPAEAQDMEDDNPIVGWHTDSYPFVCVTMLSDCTDMIGGETELRKADGSVARVRGPQMGSAVILQGRYIEHQALRALGTTERITMVTSFRPRHAAAKDDTVLTTVRPISDLGELYQQFSEYRFEILQDRLRDMNRYVRDRKRARRNFDTRGAKNFIREQIAFLEHMDKEIVDDEKVKKGVVDDSHLFSEDLKKHPKKRTAAALK